MKTPWYIQRRYVSRYSLLEAMAREIEAALVERGEVIAGSLEEIDDHHSGPGNALFLNFPQRVEVLPNPVRDPNGGFSLLQFFVDHPLGLSVPITDALSELPHFRLLMPCVDGVHALGMRWPTLRVIPCLHGVPASSLCSEPDIEARHASNERREGVVDVVVSGSIHFEPEVAALKRQVPPAYLPAWATIVDWLVEEPHTSFEQAADVVLTPMGFRPGDWTLLSSLWPSVMAEVNRRRRLSLVESLQGLDTLVIGGATWKPHCTGTIRHAGDIAYADLPSALTRARVALAWGPTQFAHSFSERLLLGLAAGCAVVADDRRLVRQVFASPGQPEFVRLFDARYPKAAREAVESLLAQPAVRHAMASMGRLAVAKGHLWRHRVPILAGAASDALSEHATAVI